MSGTETMGVLQQELRRYRKLLLASRQQREMLERKPSVKALQRMLDRKQSIIEQIGELEGEIASRPDVRLTKQQRDQAEGVVAEIREMIREMARLEEESREILSARAGDLAGDLLGVRSSRRLQKTYADTPAGPPRFLDRES